MAAGACAKLAAPLPASTKRRQLGALFVARCAYTSSLLYTRFASSELLYRIFQGEKSQSQRLFTILETLLRLVAFNFGPVAGALMDRYGRKPFLVCGPLVAAAIQIHATQCPSVGNYVIYHLFSGVAAIPVAPAFGAAVADILDPTSDECTSFISQMAMADAGVTVLGMVGAGVTAAMSLHSGLSETLRSEKRRSVDWKRLRNPLGSLQLFWRSDELTRLAFLHVLRIIPQWNNFEVLWRTRFGWCMKDVARQALLGAVVSFAGRQCGPRVLKRLGVPVTLALDGLAASALALFGIHSELLAKASSAFLLLRHGTLAFNRALAEASQRVGVGEGEKAAALANLTVLPDLFSPYLFSEVFARTEHSMPEASTLLSAALYMMSALAAFPCSPCASSK